MNESVFFVLIKMYFQRKPGGVTLDGEVLKYDSVSFYDCGA